MDEDIKKFIQEKWNSTNINRFPGPQPISIERRHIRLLSEKRYFVCEKTDGVRHFLVCFTDSQNRKICALVDRSFRYTLYSLTVPRDTLLDGELIDDKFIVHDAVCIQGEDLRSKNLDERLSKVRALVKIIVPSKIRVTCKNMIPFCEINNFTMGDKTDGCIFTPVDEPIRMGTHRTMFKWKPFDAITIDFLVTKDGQFCVQHEGKLIVIQKGECKYTGIVECAFKDERWIPIKPREDKSHPNNKLTYERTLVNIRENIQFDEFVHG